MDTGKVCHDRVTCAGEKPQIRVKKSSCMSSEHDQHDPGDALEEDDGYEYEEEEELVLVELSGVVQAEVTPHDLAKFKLLGAHTEAPILQIGGLVFQGRLEPAMGTAVFFNEVENTENTTGDLVFSRQPEKTLEYFDKTQHVLKMKRVFIKKKDKDVALLPAATEES